MCVVDVCRGQLNVKPTPTDVKYAKAWYESFFIYEKRKNIVLKRNEDADY